MVHVFAVLGGEHYGVDALGLAVYVFHRDLGLGVRTEPGENLVLTKLSELFHQTMRVMNGHGHKFFGLIAGEAEHHALIAGALFLEEAFAFGHALGDIGALFIEGDHDRAGLAVEADGRIGITGTGDGFAHHLLEVDVRLGRDLAGYHHEAGGDQGLASHAALGILFQHRIEDGVGNLVGHLIGMAHGNGFGSEEVSGHVECSPALFVPAFPGRPGKGPYPNCTLFRA